MEKRKVELFSNNEWVETEIKDLKKHDKFRFDDCYKITYIAIEDPVLSEDNIWEIESLIIYQKIAFGEMESFIIPYKKEE